MVMTMTLLVILNANIVEISIIITQFLMKIIKKISMPWVTFYFNCRVGSECDQ